MRGGSLVVAISCLLREPLLLKSDRGFVFAALLVCTDSSSIYICYSDIGCLLITYCYTFFVSCVKCVPSLL